MNEPARDSVILVTGGGGFLGRHIVEQLLSLGYAVRTFSRSNYPNLVSMGVDTYRGDMVDADAVAKAVAGVDLVIHTAAKAGVWGSHRSYHEPNVVGTQVLLDACRSARVRRLVYTSSPSVTFAGEDESGVDESTPYPPTYMTYYQATKAEAERAVLAANGREMATTSLRPHLIWGPGDPHLVPRVVERARTGRLRIVGDGKNLVDSTCVENAAQAHVLAAIELLEHGPEAACAGKAYFISNGEPLPMPEILNRILAAAGLPAIERKISARMAWIAGAVLEAAYAAARIDREPPMTRFVARQLATAHWYDLTAARRDLGYQPAVSIDEGMKNLAAWFAERGEANAPDPR